MTLIVDASVAIKWGVYEPDTPKAMALVGASALIAPDLAAAEIANALWKKVMRGEVASGQAATLLAACLSGYVELVPSAGLAGRALELAATLRHPAYDCFYLALAESRGAPFVTADARLLGVLATGGWAGAYQAL